MTTLKERVKELEAENAQLKEQLESQPTASVSDTRQDLRLAMVRAGMIRREYAKTDAELCERAIDEILKVWGA